MKEEIIEKAALDYCKAMNYVTEGEKPEEYSLEAQTAIAAYKACAEWICGYKTFELKVGEVMKTPYGIIKCVYRNDRDCEECALCSGNKYKFLTPWKFQQRCFERYLCIGRDRSDGKDVMFEFLPSDYFEN